MNTLIIVFISVMAGGVAAGTVWYGWAFSESALPAMIDSAKKRLAEKLASIGKDDSDEEGKTGERRERDQQE